MKKRTFIYSFQASILVMTGYIVLGIGFGILLRAKGYGVLWALAMSGFIFAGAMQYVAVELMAGGVSLLSTALMTIMVNIRHLFYGISMLDKYRGTGKRKPYLIFALTDETFSLVADPKLPEDVDRHGYYFVLSLLNQFWWILGSVIGNLVGDILPFSGEGIDFSMTALFTVIFLGQWESTTEHKPALIGMAVSVICLLVFGPQRFLLPSMVLITGLLFLLKKTIRTKGASRQREDGAGVGTEAAKEERSV